MRDKSEGFLCVHDWTKERDGRGTRKTGRKLKQPNLIEKTKILTERRVSKLKNFSRLKTLIKTIVGRRRERMKKHDGDRRHDQTAAFEFQSDGEHG